MKYIARGMIAVAAAAFAMTAVAETYVTVPNQVPEPGTLALLATGIVAVAITRLRNRK